MASPSLLPCNVKTSFPHNEASAVSTRQRDDNKRRYCRLVAVGLVVLFALGLAANCCASDGSLGRSSQQWTAESQEVHATEPKEDPVLIAISAEEALEPIKLHMRQDDGAGLTPVPSVSDNNGVEPQEPTSSEDVVDPPATTETSGPPAATTTAFVTTETVQVPTDTATVAPPTTEEEQDTSTTEVSPPKPTTTIQTQPPSTSDSETMTLETSDALDTTTTGERTTTTTTREEESSTTTEAESTTTANDDDDGDEEEDEPTSSPVEEIITSTLEGGIVTTITSTSWVEVDPTSEPSNGEHGDSDPDLQNIGVTKSPALAMVVGLAATAFLIS